MSVGTPLYLGRPWRQGSLLLLLYLMSPSLVAQSNEDRFGGEGYGEAALQGGLEATNIGLAAIGTVLFIVAAKRFRKSSDGIALGYHAGGIALLGMTRVFDILADRGVIYVHDDTLEFWWHMIFFMAMAMFVFGAKVLSDIDGEGSRLGTPQSLKRWCIVSVVVTIALFLHRGAPGQRLCRSLRRYDLGFLRGPALHRVRGSRTRIAEPVRICWCS